MGRVHSLYIQLSKLFKNGPGMPINTRCRASPTLKELQQNQHEKASLVCVRVQSPSGLALVPCALSMMPIRLGSWVSGVRVRAGVVTVTLHVALPGTLQYVRATLRCKTPTRTSTASEYVVTLLGWRYIDCSVGTKKYSRGTVLSVVELGCARKY